MEFIVKLFPFLKFLTICYLIYKLGIIYGYGLFYVLEYIYIHIIMLKLFNYYPLSYGDKTFTFLQKSEKYNIVGLFKFDQIKREEIKKLIIERGIKKVDRLSFIRRIKFFEFWWEKLPIDEVLSKVSFIDDNSVLNDEKDVIRCINKYLKYEFDVENELGYRFIFANNPNSKQGPFLLINFDHAVTDGQGFVSLICTMADNYSLKLFPSVRMPSYLDFIISYIMIPYSIYLFITSNLQLMQQSSKPCPIRMPIDVSVSGESLQGLSKHYNFSDFSKVCKKLKMTFNDLMTGIVSAAFNKIFKEHFKSKDNIENLCMCFPTGTKGFPKTIDGVRMENDSPGFGICIKLIDNPLEETKNDISGSTNLLRNFSFRLLNKSVVKLIHYILPMSLRLKVLREKSKEFIIPLLL